MIGLGRVGLPLALSFADRGLQVLGIDHDPNVLDSLRPAGCRSRRPEPRSCSIA